MAEVAHTSPRHLTRLFVEHAGVAPLYYVRRIRLAVAQSALESGRNVTQAAELAAPGLATVRDGGHAFDDWTERNESYAAALMCFLVFRRRFKDGLMKRCGPKAFLIQAVNTIYLLLIK